MSCNQFCFALQCQLRPSAVRFSCPYGSSHYRRALRGEDVLTRVLAERSVAACCAKRNGYLPCRHRIQHVTLDLLLLSYLFFLPLLGFTGESLLAAHPWLRNPGVAAAQANSLLGQAKSDFGLNGGCGKRKEAVLWGLKPELKYQKHTCNFTEIAPWCL